MPDQHLPSMLQAERARLVALLASDRPAFANEWRAGVYEVIYGHLAGEHTVGVYPLLEDDSRYLLAVDFVSTRRTGGTMRERS